MATPTILITGATGFIGGAAVWHLLCRVPTSRLLLLVRANDLETARQRVRQSITRFGGGDCSAQALDRCEFLPGDLTRPETLGDRRLAQMTHVLHLAANTSLGSSRSVRQTNLDGTVALAQRMRRAPRLERFLYVSTAYLCGPDARPVVREDDYPRPGIRHLAEYTRSKAECELLLEETMPDLPLMVARPSVVVGHTTLGCKPSASIFWYYRALSLLGRLPIPAGCRKDVIPVDYAAGALVHLLLKPHLAHRRYHVSAGQTATSNTWGEIAENLVHCQGGRALEPPRVVDLLTFLAERHRLREILGPGDEELLLRAMAAFFPFSACGAEVFDNTRLLSEGMPPSPRFTDYLKVCARDSRTVYEQMKDDL
jgi:nucleoside-diphosphate-sugar epimerase